MTPHAPHSATELAPPDRRSRFAAPAAGDQTHTVKVLGSGAEIVVGGAPAGKRAAIAATQRGRLSRRQLLAAGVTPDVIDGWLRRGLMFRLHAGVYAVGHVAPVDRGRETAALLAVRDGAALSHDSAAILWQLAPPDFGDGLVHVLVSGSGSRAPVGVRIHRTRVLGPDDLRRHSGLPVTSPARALLDIAGRVTHRRLERALDQAIVSRILVHQDLTDLLSRTRGCPGHPRLAALVERQRGTKLTRSEAEERFLALVRRAELPKPAVNLRVCGYEVDFHWRPHGPVVEIDGFRFHSTRRAFEADRRRDATFAAAGIAVLRFTWNQLVNQAPAVVARLAQALARGRSAYSDELPGPCRGWL